MKLLLHLLTSLHGPEPKSRDARYLVAIRGKADVPRPFLEGLSLKLWPDESGPYWRPAGLGNPPAATAEALEGAHRIFDATKSPAFASAHRLLRSSSAFLMKLPPPASWRLNGRA
jgi:hypothetical protein